MSNTNRLDDYVTYKADELIDSDYRFNWGRAILWTIGGAFAVLLLGIVLTYFGFIGGWATQPARTFSVENVQQTYADFYSQRRQLEAEAINIKNYQANIDALYTSYGQDTTKWPSSAKDELRQWTSLIGQMQSAYNTHCADYKAKWDNVFKSAPAPTDLPRDCPYIEGVN